jgi:hypothetical protein
MKLGGDWDKGPEITGFGDKNEKKKVKNALQNTEIEPKCVLYYRAMDNEK